MANDTPKRRLFRRPMVFTSQLFTSGNGTIINGGAVIAGDARDFPPDAFVNALDRPFFATRIKMFVGRVAGGDEVDSDYDNVLFNLQDLVTNDFITKDPVPLSALLDKQRREWLFHPGMLSIRKNGGGLKPRVQVMSGAIGSPYNVSIAVHGYTEQMAAPSDGLLPEET